MVEQGNPDTQENPESESSEGIGQNPEAKTIVIIEKEEIVEKNQSPRAALERSGLSSDSDNSSNCISISPTGKTETPETKLMLIVKKDDYVEEGTSPRTVLESPISSSDSDNSSNSISPTTSSSDSSSGRTNPTPETAAQRALVKGSHGLHWRYVLDVLKRKSGRKFSTIPLKGSRENSRKKKLTRIRSAEDGNGIDCGGLKVPKKPSWRNFDYSELAAATNDFSPESLIGKGGHAEVYKGCLPDGQLVAVKRLIKKDKEEEIRIADFLSELGIIAHIDHPKAARLLGFSIDGGLHLVLQFSPHGSLASVLHGSAEGLEWKLRFKVAVGIAEGLQYLHHGCQRRIIHRDIKASNILLTEDYEPQISDFGLAKWLPEKWAHHVVFPIEGTFGYLAPEYFMHGLIDEKTDVFAYGVLLLELITGRRAVDSCRQSLVMWAKPFLDSNNIKELADPRLNDAYDVVEMKRAILAASMCINHLSKMRPDMRRVLQTLKGDVGLLEWKQKSVSGRAVLLDACDLEDYTCTKYLNDLDRHMQLAME